MVRIDPLYDAVISAELGDTVWDDLEHRNARIVRMEVDAHGNLAYYLDVGEVREGDEGRFPWEISPARSQG